MSIWKLFSLFIKGCEGLLKNIHNLSIENKQYGHKCLSCLQITAASHKKTFILMIFHQIFLYLPFCLVNLHQNLIR